MKILFLTNNEASSPLVEWLGEREFVKVWREKLAPDDIRAMDPDWVVSYSYRHIIKQEVLDTLPDRFVNLHVALLPFNRGADPNAWSILEGTPKGVTIHIVDSGIDTGPILFQKEVRFDDDKDTLGGSYDLLQEEIQDLFMTNWDAIRSASAIPVQQLSTGTYHHSREFAAIKDSLLGTEGWGVNIAVFKDRYRRLIGN